MRTQMMLGAAAFAAATIGLSAPASAQPYGNNGQGIYVEDPYCKQQKQNRMLAGAAIGGVVGAVLGNNVAARNAQSEGSILGGVAGAAAGAAIGRSTARCAGTTYSSSSNGHNGYSTSGNYPYGEPPNSYPASQTGYPDDDYGLHGGPGTVVGSSSGSNNCRWGSVTTRDPDGREIRESVYMCRSRDGVWRRSSQY